MSDQGESKGISPRSLIQEHPQSDSIFYVDGIRTLDQVFPPKGGVSTSVSTNTIFTGVKFDYNKHCHLQFFQYAQVNQENTPANSQAIRTYGFICVGPSGNI